MAEPEIDAFGYIQHGSSTPFLTHNRHVAYGGSAGGPNIADPFLLRLKQDSNGDIEDPLQYYSYYDGEYHPFEHLPISIPRKDGTVVDIELLHAGTFGLVVNPTPFWGIDSEAWAIGDNVFQETRPATNPELYIPHLVTLRSPIDFAVDPSPRNSRLAVAMYKWMKARSVYDVVETINSGDASFSVNFNVVDRDGRVLSTLLGNIPKRGDDAALALRGYSSYPDKVDLYSKDDLDRDPVPARYRSDRDFDWHFEVPGDPTSPIVFLKILFPGSGNADFHPFTIWDPAPPYPYAYPALTTAPDGTPDSFAARPFYPGHLGFSSMSNDALWFSYTKEASIQLKKGASYPRAVDDPFNVAVVPDNKLLHDIMESGTGYHTWAFPLEALEKTKYTVTHLEDRVLPADGSPALLPLSLDEAKLFAQDDRLYIERDYAGPFGVDVDAAELDELKTLPVTVRVLKEVVNDLNASDGLEAELKREGEFFRDLWATLHSDSPGWRSYRPGPAGSPTHDLKALWVDNALQSAFWHPSTDPGSVTLQWFDLPPILGLIDFYWQTSLPFVVDAQGNVDAFTGAERDKLNRALDLLIEWDTPATVASERYRRRIDSSAATLLEQYRLSFNADDPEFSRGWTPLWNGHLATDGVEHPDFDCLVDSRAYPLLADGSLPSIPGDEFRLDFARGWGEFRRAAFPLSTHSSTYGLFTSLGDWRIDVPFDALYESPGVVRLAPTAEHINALVIFFLQLGGFWDDSEGVADDSRVNKTAAFDRVVALEPCPNGAVPLRAFQDEYRVGYPLTRNMARAVLLRRLIDTQDAVEQMHGGVVPPWGDVFQTRILDFSGQQRFPASGEGVPCVGPALRSVGIEPATATSAEAAVEKRKGVQPKLWCYGGSSRIIATFFPKPDAGAGYEAPLSFFWNTPGQRIAHVDSEHFSDMAGAYSSRNLLDTHFTDYLLNLSGSLEFPNNPATRVYIPGAVETT